MGAGRSVAGREADFTFSPGISNGNEMISIHVDRDVPNHVVEFFSSRNPEAV